MIGTAFFIGIVIGVLLVIRVGELIRHFDEDDLRDIK
jgi:hypothetical protein